MDMDACCCSFEDTAFLANSCAASFALFMSMVEYVLRSQCSIADPCGRAGRDAAELIPQLGDPPEVDFIVVGAGVAGPALAARLSERLDWTVLLLEAGPEEPTATLIPSFAVSAEGTQLDWNYTTEVQENACLSSGGICSWPRGKMVSGTGGMQGMMYTRGHPSIYDSWEADGNEGWGYEDVLPYFILSENNLNVDELDEGYHGSEGPLVVQHFAHHPPLTEAIVQAGVELGYRNGDLNGANQTGFAIAQMMVSDGLRGSTPRLYLRPAAERGNIHTAINAQATRVIIDPDTLVATGVEFLDSNGNTQTVQARREVILSAGAIGSPQLLMLSGIGPRDNLEEVGITVLRDAAVGDNLHNHVSGYVAFYIDDPSTESLTTSAVEQFVNNRTGPLSGTGLTQMTGFLKSQLAGEAPDLQVFFDGINADCSRSGLAEECTDGQVPSTQCGRRYVDSRPTNIMPRSRGYMRLRSADPLDYPILQPNYLSDEEDITILVDGIKLLIALTQTEALAPWNFTLDETVTPGCEDFEFGSDDYWRCVVRYSTGPENHQGGSCKMGPDTDPTAVVDPQFRVHGVTNLRVVDASVFPRVPNSNPISAIIMLAERAAEFIKADWPEETAGDTRTIDVSKPLKTRNN